MAAALSHPGDSGRICAAGARVFVQEAIYGEVAERITRIAADPKVGDLFEPATKRGPVISRTPLDRVTSHVDAGGEGGATLLAGGTPVEGPGFFIGPIVFSGVAQPMTIARDEIPGPVASLIPFKDEGDAIPQASDSTDGPAAAVRTRAVSRAHQVAKATKAGRTWVDTFGETDPAMPFGGFRQSGFGRESGAGSVLAHAESQSIQVRL
ncbi:aldehyde dehydrogenase family protein [Pseudorhodoferax sp.]|uniref:aldehyde dehydrogenase family protein n=1 Tax=Pseudorhodoferax sp. TaxID=1993553 RepID=UPI0039E2F662